jgi:hypothetical protein
MARLRVCAEPGCPELSTNRYCPTDAAKHEQARGTRQQRGYDMRHDHARARLLKHWISGTPCPKCKARQWDPDLLDAGHSEDLRVNPDAVADQLECRPCNRGWRRGQ